MTKSINSVLKISIGLLVGTIGLNASNIDAKTKGKFNAEISLEIKHLLENFQHNTINFLNQSLISTDKSFSNRVFLKNIDIFLMSILILHFLCLPRWPR